MTIEDLNRAERGRFVEALGWVYEGSPWVAERAWARRPFRSLDELHDVMTAMVEAADEDAKLTLLRAHPDLGARVAMSQASAAEQTGAGLDRLTRDEFGRLRSLNQAYTQKFGFPFIYAVKAGTRHDLFAALERRLAASREEEIAEALRQVSRIARFRLEDVIA